MGTFKKGILGGFSGTVGTVVGGNWKGIDYMRSRPTTRSSSTTTAQDVQRAKFKLAATFLRSMKDLLNITFGDFAGKMTGTNSALSYTLKNAIAGEYPDLKIDYTLALVARGSLPNAAAPVATSTVAAKIAFSWTDNTGIGKAKADDKAILIAYCEELHHCIFIATGVLRNAGAGVLDVPGLSGKTVQTWLSFVAVNGKDVAPSIHTGAFAIL